jgi:hypothetical protein
MSKPYWTNVCRHYTNGADVVNDKKCAKGVCYLSVTAKPGEPGSAYRIPCHTPTGERELKIRQEGSVGTCEHFSALTEEEIAQQEKESKESFERAIKRMELTAPLITAVKKKYRGRSIRGIRTCPVCQGKLHISHSAYNGHVHARCETDGCVAFME